ncbi:MAG: AI-2E family transporter [Anaerolineae bacterium]
MANETSGGNLPPPLVAAAELGQSAWRRLGLRLRSITPSGMVRFVLVIGALAAIGWVIWSTRLALLPFLIGGVIAYILLPTVNRLDRVMPRGLAVLITLGGTLLVVGLFLALLVPPLAQQVVRLYQLLPGMEELRRLAADARAYIDTLPEPTQNAIDQVVQRATVTVRENMDTFVSGMVTVVITTVITLLNTIGFILGFVVIPAWLLSVLQDQRAGVRAINRLLPNWMEADFWAVLRIIDRTFSAFLRGQFALAFAVGLLTYIGLKGMEAIGLINIQYELLLAIFAALMQLVPTIGPILSTVPAVLIGWSFSNEVALFVLGLYLLVQWLVMNFVAPRVERSVIDLHPALLVIVIVAISEFGFLWVLLAAPITAVVRDLFLYAFGRFSNPPRPAGVLPGEPLPAPATASPVTRRRHLPLIYRRQASARRRSA